MYLNRTQVFNRNIKLSGLPNQVMSLPDNASFQMMESTEALSDESQHPYYLHWLARNGDSETLARVMNRKDLKKNVNLQDGDRLTALHYAARYNHYGTAKILVDNGADIQAGDREGATPLHYATRRKPTPDKVKESVSVLCLLSAGGSHVINCKDKYGSTPLHYCAMRGNDVAATTILNLDGSNPDVADLQGETPLHIAAIYGHLTIAEILAEGGASNFIADNEDITPLHLAAMEGTPAMIDIIFNNLTDTNEIKKCVDMIDKDGNTALHLAVENGHCEAAALLIAKYGADVKRTCRMATKNLTALHLAAVSGKAQLVKLLIDNGAKVGAQDLDLQTPLHKAAASNNKEAGATLLQAGMEYINYRDSSGSTPLIAAARAGSDDTLQVLLSHGADVCIEDTKDKNAFFIAVESCHVGALELLLAHVRGRSDYKVLVNADDPFGNSPIHVASRKGVANIVQKLLDNGADLMRKNDDEMTPFLLAAENGHKGIVKMLLDRNPDLVYDEDEASNTALHLAATYGHPEVAEILINKRADAEARNAELWTPLDCAACAGKLSVVRLLLKCGVSVDPIGRDKRTPLHWASERGHSNVVRELLKAGSRLSITDHFQQNALDIAIEKGHEEAALAIVNSADWTKAFRNSTFNRKKKCLTSPMRKLIYTMPSVAKVALDRCMTPSKHSPEDEDFYVMFSYEFIDDTFLLKHWESNSDEYKTEPDHAYDNNGYLLPTAEPYTPRASTIKSNHPLKLMSKYEDEALLTHPLTLTLLANKWRTARIMYFLYLVMFGAFLSFLTSYLMVAKAPYLANITLEACGNSGLEPYLSRQTEYEKVVKYIIWAFAFLGIFLELMQVYQIRSHYLAPSNVIDWFTYTSAILVTVDFTHCGLRTDWQWQLSAVSLFIAWMNLLLFLRRFPFFGLYVVMIIDILWTFIKFFIVFFLFIVAFALGFYLLLANQVGFREPIYSIVKTTVMMIGEFEYDSLFNSGIEEPNDPHKRVYYYSLTYAFFYFFALLMSIIVMNLLTGLAVDDVSALQEKAKIRKLAMQVDLALDVELGLPGPIARARCMVLQFEKLYPNIGAGSLWHSVVDAMSDLVAGSSDKTEQEIAKTILGNQEEAEENSSEMQELETRLTSEIHRTQTSVSSLNEQMNRLEDKLTAVLQAIQSRP